MHAFWRLVLRAVKAKQILNQSQKQGWLEEAEQLPYRQIKSKNRPPKSSRFYFIMEDSRRAYLTKRELDCVAKLMDNHTVLEAADALNLSKRTVES